VDPNSVYNVVVKRNIPSVPDRISLPGQLCQILKSHTSEDFEYSEEAQ